MRTTETQFDSGAKPQPAVKVIVYVVLRHFAVSMELQQQRSPNQDSRLSCILNMSAWQLASLKALNNAGAHNEMCWGAIQDSWRDDLQCCLSLSVHGSSVNNAAATSLRNEAAGDFTSGKALSFLMAVSFHSCPAPLLKDGRVPARDKQHTSVIYSRQEDVHPLFPFNGGCLHKSFRYSRLI